MRKDESGRAVRFNDIRWQRPHRVANAARGIQCARLIDARLPGRERQAGGQVPGWSQAVLDTSAGQYGRIMRIRHGLSITEAESRAAREPEAALSVGGPSVAQWHPRLQRHGAEVD